MGLFNKYYEINTVNCSLADYSKGYSICLHQKKAQQFYTHLDLYQQW